MDALPQFEKGHILSGHDMASLVSAIDRLNNIKGSSDGGVRVRNDSTGIHLWSVPGKGSGFPAIIQNAGPNGEADYSNNRYWVKSAYCSNTTTTWTGGSANAESNFSPTDAITLSANTSPNPYYAWLTATNFAEEIAASHSVAVGTYVWVDSVYDQGTEGQPSTKRYFFTSVGQANVVVQVGTQSGGSGDTASGYGGKYNGTLYSGKSSVAPTAGNFSSGALSIGPTNCFVCNLAEVGGTNWVPNNSWALGLVVGETTEDTPRPIVYIWISPPNPLVACEVTDDGSGSNGSATTAATYKYNVKDLSGSTIATSLTPAKPRPFGASGLGAVIQNTSVPAYGTGFYSGSTFVLWECGEVPDLGTCPIDDSDD